MPEMIPAESFLTASLQHTPFRDSITRILSAGIEGVNPSTAIQRAVHLDKDLLWVNGQDYDISRYQRILLVAMGKAGVPMAEAMREILKNRIDQGIVVAKAVKEGIRGQFHFYEGGHPIPNQKSLLAGKEVIKTLSHLRQDDLVIFLISGGGSSLVSVPEEGISLDEIRELTGDLLSCGATIEEINTLRRRWDTLKGGKLAKIAFPAQILSFILSDVMGDPLESIASGPTAPDPNTNQDALDIINKYQLKAPSRLMEILLSGDTTVKPGDPILNAVHNTVIANNTTACRSALIAADKEGFHTQLLTTRLVGEASKVAKNLSDFLIRTAKTGNPIPRPGCIVAGGETTVTLNQNPLRGGRNTELALSAVPELDKIPGVMLITLATDGEDGKTDAAGAVVDGLSFQRAQAMGLNPTDSLGRHDSYTFFSHLNDLVKPGTTGTNAGDLTFMFTF